MTDSIKAPRKSAAKPKTKAGSATIGGTASSLYGIEPYVLTTGEEYMSEGQLDHFKRILNAWRAELMQEVDRTMTHMQDESNVMADVNDRATQEEEFAIELRTRDRERKLIRKIEKSLKDID